jgi:hypothetical protein
MTNGQPRSKGLIVGLSVFVLIAALVVLVVMAPLVQCPFCDGTGHWIRKDKPQQVETCEECRGTGMLTVWKKYFGYSMDPGWMEKAGVGPCPRLKETSR